MSKNPLILALDVDSYAEARRWVIRLKRDVSFYKVGSVLFTAEGPRVVRMIRKAGGAVFLDLKFHDIPNTVAKACEAAARLGVFMVTLHASGGLEMLEAAVKAVRRFKRRPKLVGVTVLTSDGGGSAVSREVVRRAELCRKAGLDGVVCSVREIKGVRKKCGKKFLIVTPGIRPTGSSRGDQKRVATPEEAIRRGADFLVVGRPILSAGDPLKIVHSISEVCL